MTFGVERNKNIFNIKLFLKLMSLCLLSAKSFIQRDLKVRLSQYICLATSLPKKERDLFLYKGAAVVVKVDFFCQFQFLVLLAHVVVYNIGVHIELFHCVHA